MDKNTKLLSDLENKYIELEKIFKPNTIEYLKSNGYKFENNLHKFTLQCLYEEKYDIFEDILLKGLYDNDYSMIIENKNIIKNGKNLTIKFDLLNLMAEKGYYDIKYYIPIINSNKKNLNFFYNNGCTWLYNSVQKFTYKYKENTIIEIIKNCDTILINSSKRKVYKFLKQIFNLDYDKLLYCLLKKNALDNNEDCLIQILQNKNLQINKLFNSSDLLYKFIKYNSVGKINVNHTNYETYLKLLRKLICSNEQIYIEELKQDYINVICSDYIYNYVLNILGFIAIYYYIDNNTMLAKEILENIDINKSITYFKDFESDIIEYNLVKLYENISKGIYSKDYIVYIKNIILIKNKIEVKYKDIDDFKIKIKSIIPELLKISNLNNLDMLLTFVDKSIIDCNEELTILLLKNNEFNSYKFFKYIETEIEIEKPNSIEMYNFKYTNKQIILNLLSNNMDEIILYMIETLKIELCKSWDKYSNIIFDSYKLQHTFLELLFKNNKIPLIKKILDNQKINNKYGKNTIIQNILFLSLYYNINEMTYHIFENHLQYVNPDVFIFSFKYKLILSEHANNFQTKINNNPYANISGVELLFKMNSDWIIDKFIEQYFTKLPHYIIDEKSNSLITLIIKNNKITRLEQVINHIGKKIFSHIPMFVLNSYNISHNIQLSNGLELYWACKKNVNNIAWFFVSNKLGNLNYIDSDGNTCLILACENNMESVAHEIICHTHNISFLYHKNILGNQALYYAKKNNLKKICELLDKKINSTVQSNILSTPQNHTKSSNNNKKIDINVDPFKSQNLKQSELIFLTNWIHIKKYD